MNETNCIVAEAKTWSEIPAVIEKYMQLVGNNTCRVFGYGSLMWDHASLKGNKSEQLDNYEARVEGASVDMNIYAAGPNEFRGSDKSTGRYIGMSPTGNPADVTRGINITINQSEFPAAIINFAGRELGEAPKGIDISQLFKDGKFNPESKTHFGQYVGKTEDALKMYTFQIIETVENEVKIPAFVVSANTQSQFYAGGTSVLNTAYDILNGQGYQRDDNGGRPGGSSLDYFLNQVKNFREKRGKLPERLEQIAEAVYRLAAYESRASKALVENNVKALDALALESPREDKVSGGIVPLVKNPIISPIRSRLFDNKTAFVDRPVVSQAEKIKQLLPQTGEAKLNNIKNRFEKGDLDILAPNLAPDRGVSLR